MESKAIPLITRAKPNLISKIIRSSHPKFPTKQSPNPKK
jgi:hypothetical protein